MHIFRVAEYHGMSGKQTGSNQNMEVRFMCNNNGFGGNCCWWIIILLILLCGCGGNGLMNGNGCGCDNRCC